MPRVVVPTESEERAASHSHRRRKVIAVVLALLCLAAAGALALKTWRDRARKANAADTAFVSAPAWPKTEARPLAPKPTLASKEYLLQLAAYTSKLEAEELQARLAGLAWPVSIVVPVSATDSLNKVIVSGIADKATARRVADSLGAALHLRVTIIEPTGTRSK
jgi:cell division septation protein DedD